MLVKNVCRRLSRPRGRGGISQAKTGSSAKASASTSPSRAASSRRAARTACEPPRGDTVSWVTGLLLPHLRPVPALGRDRRRLWRTTTAHPTQDVTCPAGGPAIDPTHRAAPLYHGRGQLCTAMRRFPGRSGDDEYE